MNNKTLSGVSVLHFVAALAKGFGADTFYLTRSNVRTRRIRLVNSQLMVYLRSRKRVCTWGGRMVIREAEASWIEAPLLASSHLRIIVFLGGAVKEGTKFRGDARLILSLHSVEMFAKSFTPTSGRDAAVQRAPEG